MDKDVLKDFTDEELRSILAEREEERTKLRLESKEEVQKVLDCIVPIFTDGFEPAMALLAEDHKRLEVKIPDTNIFLSVHVSASSLDATVHWCEYSVQLVADKDATEFEDTIVRHAYTDMAYDLIQMGRTHDELMNLIEPLQKNVSALDEKIERLAQMHNLDKGLIYICLVERYEEMKKATQWRNKPFWT